MFPALNYLYNPNGTRFTNRGQYRSTGWAGSLGEFGSLLQQRVQQMGSAMNVYGRTASQNIGFGVSTFPMNVQSAIDRTAMAAMTNPINPPRGGFLSPISLSNPWENQLKNLPLGSFTSPAGVVNQQQRPVPPGLLSAQGQAQTQQPFYVPPVWSMNAPLDQYNEILQALGAKQNRSGRPEKAKGTNMVANAIQDKAYWQARAVAEGRSPDYYAGRGAGGYDDKGRFYHSFNQANYKYYGTGRGGEGEPNYERSGGDPRWWLKGKRKGGAGRPRKQQGEPPISAISNYAINWRVGAG